MKPCLAILLVLTLLPLASAGAGWENKSLIDPGGAVNALLNGLGMGNQSENNMTNGGGNPAEYISDPIISWINETLGTKWGFLIFITILSLFGSYFAFEVIGAAIGMYLGYLLGTVYIPGYTFWLMVALIIVGLYLGHRWKPESKTFDKFKALIKWLLILFVIGVIALFIINASGIIIPGLTD